jgi:hypothetical protein
VFVVRTRQLPLVAMRAIRDDERRRIAALEQLCASAWAERPSTRLYGHLRVRSGPRTREVLLASESHALRDGTMLVDWERAPLGEVFLDCEVGDDYELELGERSVEGVVLARALLWARASEQGQQLVGVDDGEVWLRRGDAGWTAEPSGRRRCVELRELDARRRSGSPVEVVLDAMQQAAVALPSARSLLILGEAGFGKTTVALHRLARLASEAARRHVPFSALVLVPTRGLRRLIVALLERMGVALGESSRGGRVEVRTFERWVAEQGRRAFVDLPERDSVAAPLAASRIKRHPALRVVLPDVVAGTPAMRAIERGYRDDERQRPRDDLLHLFGDRELLARVAAASGAQLTPRMIQQLVAHTKIQFMPTTERQFAHVVTPDRLVTVDGQSIDASTPMQDVESIDVEDFAVLFALDRLRHADAPDKRAAPREYDLIVLDEAQEFAAIELELIGRARAAGGSITIAGDEHQQVDETTVFPGWAAALHELACADACEQVTLRESYRCPPAIEALARALFDATLAPPPATASIAYGEVAHELELVDLLVHALASLRERDRLASVALVCRFAASARRLHGLLAKAIECRLVVDGDFRFGPGISVTCIDEIKGLEFDYVIVPDASAANYPDTPEARRALYVALTRAMHRLWILWAGRRSPLINP